VLVGFGVAIRVPLRGATLGAGADLPAGLPRLQLLGLLIASRA
jgi:hypothetical protein